VRSYQLRSGPEALSNALTRLANEFGNARTQKFGNNQFGAFVRQDCKSIVEEIVGKPFTADASVGKGQWTDVPWISIFHSLETDTAQRGFYIVYLLNSNKRTISLSLNQGVKGAQDEAGTGKRSLELLRTRAKTLLKRAGEIPANLSETTIELNNPMGPGRGYEAGHAFGKTYSLDQLKDSKALIADLTDMLVLYKFLVTQNGYAVRDDSDVLEFPNVKETKKASLHKRYDRLGNANTKVKAVKGFVCEVCNFDFEKTYGEIGKKFIEAHHLVPFAELVEDQSRSLNIMKDFAVLCANCHRMIHRQKDPSDLELLKNSLKK